MSTANFIGLCMFPVCVGGWILYLRRLRARRTTLRQLIAADLTGFVMLIGCLMLASYLVWL